MPPADSHCLKTRVATRLLTGCVCLHAYLVFKEPTAARQWRPTRHLAHSHRPGRCLEGPAACRPRQRLGEPCEVTITTDPCQPPPWQRQTFRRLLMSWKDARARNCCVNPGRFPTGERIESISYRFEHVKSTQSSLSTQSSRPSVAKKVADAGPNCRVPRSREMPVPRIKLAHSSLQTGAHVDERNAAPRKRVGDEMIRLPGIV